MAKELKTPSDNFSVTGFIVTILYLSSRSVRNIPAEIQERELSVADGITYINRHCPNTSHR